MVSMKLFKHTKEIAMKKILLYIIIALLSISFANAQGRVITGQVFDSSGAVVGASVVQKDIPSNGVSTNAEGRFRIQLKGNGNVLEISAVGYYSKRVDISRDADISVVLIGNAEGGTSSEVVVVGYSKQKKITLTGSVSTISGKELRENPSASLQNTMAGKLPGFSSVQASGRPGRDGANFYIRGVSSYNEGSTQPLIIVDDIEYSYDQFARLDPNEIESVSILKDASTTAVYGVKGANGVVVITTRRGKLGPPKISTRLETSLQQPAMIPEFLNSYESAKLYTQAQINDGLPRRFTDAEIEKFRTHEDPYGYPDVNWREVLFKKFSRQYRTNFDISGGTEKVKYFISMGGLYQDGMLKNYSKDQDVNSNYYHVRYNYRSNLDIKATPTTDIRVDLYGNIGEINNPNIGSPFGYNDIFYEYSSFLSLAPWAYPVQNPNGSFGYSDWQLTGGYTSTSYNTNNVVGRLTHYGYNRDHENNINLITSVNQKLDVITKGLSIKGTISYTSNYSYSRGMTRDQFPSFIYNPANGSYRPRDANVYRVRRFFAQYNGRSTERTVNIQAILNYERTFGDHRIYALALANQSSFTATNTNPVYNFIPNNFRGFTGRVGYNFQEKYLFEFNSAYNGSDRFSEKHRYGFFPAVSVGWNVSKTKFVQDHVKAISLFKLRASYGLVGNDKIGRNFAYYYQQFYAASGAANFGTQSNNFPGIAEGTLGNDEVSWEKEKKLDVGLDFGLFNDNLTGTIDFFDNNRFDILTTRGTVSAVFGQTLPPVNLGKVNNRGYEIELNYRGRITKDLNYQLKGTYSVAKNKIVYADEPDFLYEYQAFTGRSINTQRVYQWIGYYRDAADVANSPKPSGTVYPGDLKYADLNKDGKIDGYDQAVLGFSNVPTTTYGFQLRINFKGLSLNAFFQGAKEFNVRGVAEAIRPFSSNLTKAHQLSWTPELGDNAKFPRLSTLAGASDAISFPSTFYHIRGDYLRLKTAEIGYDLPEKFVKRLKVDAFRIYANGLNLLTWTKLDKLYQLDPEINTNTDRVNYPPQRYINFGISITF
jgi:TonB-linked SusC/RagA family outer membrane protein